MQDYIFYDNHKVSYIVNGQGQPLFFIHGFCEDKSIWNSFQWPFVKQGFKVVCIDLPGFGSSQIVAELTMKKMAEIVKAIAEKECGRERIILVGHSMGGYVSLAYGAQFGRDLRGLVLFHSHPFADTSLKRENREKSIRFIQQHGHERFVGQLFNNLFSNKNVEKVEIIVNQLTEKAKAYSSEGIIHAQKSMMNREDQTSVLKRAEFPKLFLAGKEDTTMPVQEYVSKIEQFENCTILLLDAVGHMGMFEAETETQQALLDFCFFCNQRG